MVNTMADLRVMVAKRLRESIHGREIDTMKTVDPRLPHMLGVTPIGQVHAPDNESGTIMDKNHEFWEDYEYNVKTDRDVHENIETAVRSLKEDDIFRITYPYGEEAEVIYCEVDELEENENTNMNMKTSCKECGTDCYTEPSLSVLGDSYCIKVTVDCPSCNYSGEFQRKLLRQ
jgi:hypothetical protein